MPFAIAVERVKKEVNVGTLMRSCFNLGASAIFTIGRRYRDQPGDTTKTWRHIPLIHFNSWGEYREHAPRDWMPVGVEILDEAKSLYSFIHPKAAVYILGPEDGSLSIEARALVRQVLYIPSRFCLNLAVAGSIVMYDRRMKEGEK